MITVLADQGVITVGALLHLAAEEAHHLHVRRAGSGDVIRVMDGHGTVGTGTVSVARKDARVEITDARRFPPPLPFVLAIGSGDRDRFALTVEKGTELGVTDFVPLTTARTGDVASRLRPAHVEKLVRRGLEACKQSGNPFAPRVEEPSALADFLGNPPAGARLLAARGGGPLAAADARQPLAMVVGPEGGWTDDEGELVRAAGFRPVRLADHTLRFETAAIAAAAVVAGFRTGNS